MRVYIVEMLQVLQRLQAGLAGVAASIPKGLWGPGPQQICQQSPAL